MKELRDAEMFDDVYTPRVSPSGMTAEGLCRMWHNYVEAEAAITPGMPASAVQFDDLPDVMRGAVIRAAQRMIDEGRVR